ncbi:MAG: hypothetical protein PVJ85_05260, partial [Anaerolineae bacterium]
NHQSLRCGNICQCPHELPILHPATLAVHAQKSHSIIPYFDWIPEQRNRPSTGRIPVAKRMLA